MTMECSNRCSWLVRVVFINFTLLLLVSLLLVPIAQAFPVRSLSTRPPSSSYLSSNSRLSCSLSSSSSSSAAKTKTKTDNDDDDDDDPLLLSSVYQTNLRSKIVGSIAKGERRAQERSAQLRPVCKQCGRPKNTLCVCHVLPGGNDGNNNKKLETKTTILILQHPNERRKKNLSTVPLLKLALQNVHVQVGYTFEELDSIGVIKPFVTELFQRGQKPLLLYPSPDAISLDDKDKDNQQSSSSRHDKASSSSSSSSTTTNKKEAFISSSAADRIKQQNNNLLIIMDGTWTEAKRMVRDSPKLVESCQAVQFTSEASSIYDALRSEPEPHCLSTLEACARALYLLEGEDQQQPQKLQKQQITIQDTLHNLLQAHVDAHLANARIMAPRYVGASKHKLSDKNQRRKEIESNFFLLSKSSSSSSKAAALVAAKKTGGQQTPTQQEQQLQQPHSTIITQSPRPLPFFVWQRLPDGAIMRSLQTTDAELVDSWWEYRSSKSLPLVRRRINLDLQQQQQQQQHDPTATTGNTGGGGAAAVEASCCLGIEINNQLVACIMRYEGGALGMLYVEEQYRRKGYGKALLEQATRILQLSKQERVAFIVDGNDASEGLFSSVGWEKADPNRKRKTGKRRAKRKWIHQ